MGSSSGKFSVSEWLQKLLFTTTFRDIVESIDALNTRVQDLNTRLDREVQALEKQLAETRKPSSKGP